MDKLLSYTAADIFPAKLLQNEGAVDHDGRIAPLHIQLYPTNSCNLSCGFCSCAERNDGEVLSVKETKALLTMFYSLGSRAVTITGGGEPMMHNDINSIMGAATELGYKIGLVSNGTLLHRLDSDYPTWARISLSDSRELGDDFYKNLSDSVSRFSEIDWAFSYVVTASPDYGKLRTAALFAKEHGFCHVRVVSDLLGIESTPEMNDVRRELNDVPGEEIVLYQGRKKYVRGVERCLISLLKPVIAADGGVWPCCGAQYALEDDSRDMPESMRMCHWSEFGDLWEPFNGSVCIRCYYENYNIALNLMTAKLDHMEFV